MGRLGNSTVVAVGLLVFFLGLWLASRDDPPPQDADLMPAAVPVPDADNVYPIYLKLNVALSLSPQVREHLVQQLDGKVSEGAVVEALIARSTEALALFRNFSRGRIFQDPADLNLSALSPNTPLPQFAAVVDAARLSSLQAESLLKKGRAREALEESLSVVDAGRVLTHSRGRLIVPLAGMILVEIGTKRALQVVTSGTLDRARLLDAAARLSETADAAVGLQDGFRHEYVVHTYTTDHLSEIVAKTRENKKALRDRLTVAMAKGGWYVFMPHRTKALFAGRFRLIIAEAGKPCLQAHVPPFEILPMGLRPNMMGRFFYNIAIPQYEKAYARRCETDFRVSAAAAAAALQAYRLDHGRFPATLSELTPGYLPTEPLDPFSGGALVYSADTGEVHSVGKDTDGKPL